MGWSLRHFRHLSHGYPINVRSDHAAVVELLNSKHLTGKLSRRALNIQDLNPASTFLPDKANVETDALSRLIADLHTLGPGTFKELQRKDNTADSFCSSIICYLLESGDNTPLPKLPVPPPEFKLED